MTAFAPILQAFFTDYLRNQRRASEHTVAAYRDTFRLLLTFTTNRSGKRPSALDMADLHAPSIIGFLAHLEADRGNSVPARNARLAAIHSLFGYAATRMPEHAGLIAQILAIPPKRADRPTVSYLTATEIRALLAAPDQSTWIGRRDHALLQVATQTGLRVSELTGLRHQDAWLGTGPYLRCDGKGRKQRCTPLTTATAKALRIWLTERAAETLEPLFCTWDGRPLSRDAVERLLRKNVAVAAVSCPSLLGRKVSPHVPRHSAAVALLHAGVDLTVIALYRGHETTRTVQALPVRRHDHQATRSRPEPRHPAVPAAATDHRTPLIAFLDGL